MKFIHKNKSFWKEPITWVLIGGIFTTTGIFLALPYLLGLVK